MVINSHNQARAWVLRLMKDGEIRKRQQIYRDIFALANISDEEIKQTTSSGQSRVENSLGWAISSFVKAGILDRISRSTYCITPLGRELAQKWGDKAEISQKEFQGLPVWDNYQQEILKRKQALPKAPVVDCDEFEDEVNHEENARQSIREIETELAVELLNKLQQGTAEFFEKAVLQLLLAMGYGGKENLFVHTGKSHDGGIDGVIKQDPLGIQNIYIQAKRYADSNTIGSKELQSFSGALQGHGVERGVFITTSSFTHAASEYAKKLLGKLVLIDGQRLVTLMIKYKVGIQVKHTLEICEIDEDFFE